MGKDHERIWLQPKCCADYDEGRLWSQDPDPEPCDEGVAWTEYVRADLADVAAIRAQIVTLRDALAPFVGYCVFIEHRDNDETILSGQAGRLEWRHLRTADFRRARAAYEGTQP